MMGTTTTPTATTSIVVEAVSSEPVPMGKYVATVKDVLMDTNSQYGAQVRWVFVITDGEHAGRELYAWSAYRERAGERSKLVRWYRVLTGVPPTGKFDLAVVVGKRCVIKVVERTREDGSIVSKIDDIDVYTPQPRKPRIEQQQQEPVEDPFA